MVVVVVPSRGQRMQAAGPPMTGKRRGRQALIHAPGLPVRHPNIGVRGGGGTGWWVFIQGGFEAVKKMASRLWSRVDEGGFITCFL